MVVGQVMAAPELLTYRRPREDDHPRLAGVIDEWWGGRRMRQLLPRLWLQHFTGTSWLAETGDGRLAGFLIGFVSPDHPQTAYVHMIATDLNHRRDGVGQALYERFFEDAVAAGAREVKAVTWPGNRVSVAFHLGLGFRVDDGPGAQPLYGTLAYADFDGEGDDRVVFMRELGAPAGDATPA